MNSLEGQIRDALRSEAVRLHEMPPLHLQPAPRRPDPITEPRRLWTWLAPVTAAALVIALAIALVTVHAILNGPASSVAPQPSAPTGFPRYYVALEQPDFSTGNALRLVVGDSVTGKKLAAFKAPAGAAFEGRTPTGAADDMTFIVAETHDKGKPPYPPGTADGPRSWYLLRLSPGSANPVTMTTLALQPTARNLPVTQTVLSADGQYLAVASADATTRRADLRVYSVATGHLVHAWTMVTAGSLNLLFPSDLSWVNGDTTVAFAIMAGSRMQVRTVPVAAPGTGLLTSSHVVWSESEPAKLRSVPKPGTATWCVQPTLTGDGQVVTCSTWPPYSAGGTPTATEWLAYPISSPGKPPRVIARIPPPVSRRANDIQAADTVVVHISASKVIGYTYVVHQGDAGPVTIHEFIAMDGTVRQLGTGTTAQAAWFTVVAW